MRSAYSALQAAGLIAGTAALQPTEANRAWLPAGMRAAPAVGIIFPVDRPAFPPLVSATMKTALILVGKRVGKAV
jgi:hypothetical protein